jgi:hypothetical protein
MRSARYGGKEGDEVQDSTKERYADNEVVEKSTVQVGRNIARTCLQRIKSMPQPISPVKEQMAWLPFAEWIELCRSTKEVGPVKFMGGTINFTHNYGYSPATLHHFNVDIVPKIVAGLSVPGTTYR